MDQTLVIQIISFLVTAGVLYGSFNARVKAIERQLDDQKDIKERLARIEESQKIIIDNFIKNK